MKIYLTLIILFFMSIVCYSKTINSVTIQADNMKFLADEKKSTFEGNVVAISDNYTLKANFIDVFFMERNEISKVISSGNVNFKTNDLLAIAYNAELDQLSKTIKLNGNVTIWQNDNKLEGESVTIQYERNEVTIERGDKKQVTVIFNP